MSFLTDTPFDSLSKITHLHTKQHTPHTLTLSLDDDDDRLDRPSAGSAWIKTSCTACNQKKIRYQEQQPL